MKNLIIGLILGALVTAAGMSLFTQDSVDTASSAAKLTEEFKQVDEKLLDSIKTQESAEIRDVRKKIVTTVVGAADIDVNDIENLSSDE